MSNSLERWTNPDPGRGIGQESTEYYLVALDDGSYGLFTEFDLERPRERWRREGCPGSARPTRESIEQRAGAAERRAAQMEVKADAIENRYENLRDELVPLQRDLHRAQKRMAELESELRVAQRPWWVKLLHGIGIAYAWNGKRAA